MFYKPNFCAECGEKIERVEWRPWTSRRFCDDCAPALENAIRWKTGIAVVSILVAGVFLGQIGRLASKPAANAQTLVSTASPNVSKSNQTPTTSNNQIVSTTNSATNSLAQTSAAQNKTVVNPPPPIVAVQTEASYYCGAKTQKGTICTRRVKGGGRCWQHIGKPAMLPQEKLLIQSN